MHRIAIAVLGIVLLDPSIPLGICGISAWAEELAADETIGQEGSMGRDILVAGANSVADGKSRAHITIDPGTEPVSSRASLELLLSPVAVSPNEPYLVAVAMSTASGEKPLGTVSFFPPRVGAVQAFYFNIAPLLAEWRTQATKRTDLSIALIPATRDQSLAVSAVRVVGARLVGG
jgi:hypothetical protein